MFISVLLTPCTVQVAIAELFPVVTSLLVLLIFTVFTNVCHERNKVQSVPVTKRVHPLHAGRVPNENEVAGAIVRYAEGISLMTTLFAALPPLFP